MFQKRRSLIVPIIIFTIILLQIFSVSLPSLAYDKDAPPGPYLALVLNAPPTPSLTPTSTATPSYGIILIGEVMVQPASSEPDGEWVELFNSGGGTIILSSYKLGDEETRGQGEGMVQFPAGASLAPGQVIIIAYNAANFHAVYGFNPDFEIAASSPAVPDMRKVLSWASGAISLDNSGDEVLLLDSADLLADALSWGDSSWAFYPPCPAPLSAWILERYPAYIDTNTSNDWRAQPIPTPGTVNQPPPTLTPSLTPTPTASRTATPSPTITITHHLPLLLPEPSPPRKRRA